MARVPDLRTFWLRSLDFVRQALERTLEFRIKERLGFLLGALQLEHGASSLNTGIYQHGVRVHGKVVVLNSHSDE